MKEFITSTKNPKIKNIIHIRKSSERKKQNLIIIEGEKEIEKAIASTLQISTLFICEEYVSATAFNRVHEKVGAKKVIFVSPEIFNHVAVRKNSGGMIALGKPFHHSLKDLTVSAGSIYLILEKVEKPGNLGAILRTSDAGGVDGIIVCDSQTDIFNPNVIRSSLGCVFTQKVVSSDSASIHQWVKSNHIKTYATYLGTNELYHEQDYGGRIAIIMGSEDEGLSQFWVENADVKIKIPMLGIADSMNVSVSAAVVLFEALRQRNFNL